MSDYVYYVLVGVTAGAIIAGFGLSLLISHLGSGTVNFACGAMASWSAYVYADLRRGAYPLPIPGLPARLTVDGPVGTVPALVAALATAAVVAVIVEALVFRPLARAPELARVVASIGLLVVFMSLIERRFPNNAGLRVAPILPRGSITLWGDVTVRVDGLLLAAAVIVAAAAVWFAARHTRLGLATRAAASNEQGAALLGFSPAMLGAAANVMAAVVAAGVVILASPMIQLSPTVFSLGFLVPALGAALIGRFRSFTPTIAVGLAIGIVQSAFTKVQRDISWFPKYGAREGLPFLVIVVAMVVFGERLPSRGSAQRWSLPAVPPARFGRRGVAVAVLAPVALVVLNPLWRAALMTTAVATVLALSLVVLTGFAGQASLAQMAFAGVAGFTLSRLAVGWHVPFPVAPILAAVVAAGFGLLVGLPAIKVRGTNLAIVTLAGGVAITEFVFKNPSFVGDATSGGAKVPSPKLGGWDLGLTLGTKTSRPVFGVLLVVIAAVAAWMVVNLRNSPTGRRMLAARSNERAAAAVGIEVSRVKVEAYLVSSFLAGLGGSLIGYRFGSVSDASFGIVASLTVLSVAYLGGITSVSGAVTAGMLASSGVVFYATSRLTDRLGGWETLVSGVLLIATAVANPSGIAGSIRSRTARRRSGQPVRA